MIWHSIAWHDRTRQKQKGKASKRMDTKAFKPATKKIMFGTKRHNRDLADHICHFFSFSLIMGYCRLEQHGDARARKEKGYGTTTHGHQVEAHLPARIPGTVQGNAQQEIRTQESRKKKKEAISCQEPLHMLIMSSTRKCAGSTPPEHKEAGRQDTNNNNCNNGKGKGQGQGQGQQEQKRCPPVLFLYCPCFLCLCLSFIFQWAGLGSKTDIDMNDGHVYGLRMLKFTNLFFPGDRTLAC